jgi:hypothetical protein
MLVTAGSPLGPLQHPFVVGCEPVPEEDVGAGTPEVCVMCFPLPVHAFVVDAEVVYVWLVWCGAHGG